MGSVNESNQAKGRTGEDRARRHLEGRGCRFLAANARTPFGEVDLIMQDGRETVFVEVKTRSGPAFGAPTEAITSAKLARMTRTAAWWMAENGRTGPWRVDAAAVVGDQVNHLPNLTG